MKRALLFCLLAAALCACGKKTVVAVHFPEAPVEIACNDDFGMPFINYFNIIQTPDGTYRMYFSGNDASGIAEQEWQQNLYWAESADGPFMRELPCELNQWIEEDEEWFLASPGFVFINGDRYLAYNTRTASHDHSRTGMVCKYKLIKVVLEYL